MNSSSFDLAEEVPYTYSYCDELNPLRAALPLLANGFEPPAIQHACELGFGQGVSINLHAAGAPVQWHGVDANPEHVEFAQQLAQRAQISLQLSSQRFGEYCRRGDLPDFDFIGLHGVWSWISDKDRATLTDFIARKLKPGGVLYVSYNTLPGWAAMLPLRDLMHAHLRAGDATGTAPLSRIGDAAAFAQQVMNAQAGYALVNPSLRERVQGLASEDPRYLAHEYFSRNWKPTSFSEVAAALDAADLVYAGSADYRDHVDSINLTSTQRTLLAGIGDVALRETTRDLCVNRSLRRDYWIRQPRMLDTDAKQAALRAQRVILALPEAKVALQVRGALGETALPEAQYRPILRALATGRPTTLGEIERSVRPFGIPLPQIVTAIELLIATGQVFNAQPDERICDAQAGAARMNAALCEHAHGSGAVPFLVSPVTGAGVAVPHVAQLFMLARMRGNTGPAQWATFAAAAQPHLSSTQLLDKATQFADVYWPVLRTLGIDTGIAA
ncbi:MAG TPA: class I SAM-dependent methyltransferase [Paraburkholderia sp.]|jgi:SAM-dependent methyltransferase|nr:class I SAM-dependent methyltransferase [Paraburkholderia sp.]